MRCLARWRSAVGGALTAVALGAALLVPAVAGAQAETLSEPLNLSASSTADGVLLRWDPPASGAASVTGYEILRRRPFQGEHRLATLVADTGSVDTAYLDTTATVDGERYVYRVKALSAGGVSDRSRNARIDHAAPVPQPTTATTVPPTTTTAPATTTTVPPTTTTVPVTTTTVPPTTTTVPVTTTTVRPLAREVTAAPVLTVGVDHSAAPPFVGFSRWAAVGALTDRAFEVDGVSYEIQVLAEHAGGMYLGVNRALPENFVLGVGNRRFIADDSSTLAMRSRGRYWWSTESLGWSAGDTVNINITLQGTEPAADRPLAPPTANFRYWPDRHDGTTGFSLRLSFDAASPDVDAATLKDQALQVSGASITNVDPVTAGSTARWTVAVQPDGAGAVTIALPATTDCAHAGAVCTADGRELHNRAEITVAGPASNAALGSLSLQDVALDPAFDPAETLYSAQAATGASQATIDAVAAAGGAVEFAPADADTSQPGHQIALTAGTQTPVTVTVTSADNTTTRSYWIVIDTPADTSTGEAPRLSALELDGLDPVAFQPDQTRYETQAKTGSTETTVDAVSEGSGDTVEVLTVRSDDAALAFHDADADDTAAGHQAQLAAIGDTLIVVIVTSADGKHQNAYVVLVSAPSTSRAAKSRLSHAADAAITAKDVRAEAATPTLSALTLTGAALSPTFAAATTAYTATASATTAQITVATTPADTNSAVLIAPADADPATAGHQVALAEPLAGGAATVTSIAVVVRSSDGTKLNAYTIAVTRAAPAGADATLSALTVGSATLSPAFSSDTYTYTSSVAATVDQLTVTATRTDRDATTAITPADADTNTAGHQIDLNTGNNTVTVTVTGDDDTTTRTYSVDINRGPSNDTRLSSLAVDGLTLSPAFDPDIFAYATTAQTSTIRTTITATPRHANATVAFTPADAATNTAGHQIDLQPGHTRIRATVTAEDSTTTGTYVVTVGRPATAQDASLSALNIAGARLKPAFVSTNFSYEALVGAQTSRVTIWAVSANVAADVDIIPSDADPDTPGHQIDLVPVVADGEPSETIVTVTVTSTDASAAQTYAIAITRRGALPVAQDPDISMELPDGCKLVPLYATDDDNLQPRRRWHSRCESVFVYYGRTDPVTFVERTGNAQFFKMKVLGDGEVTVHLPPEETTTANFVLLRDSEGTLLARRHLDIDGFCRNPPCDASPIVMDLEAGAYVIETVQEINWDGRQRQFRLKVEGDVMLDSRLVSISVDGTPIPGFDPAKRNYRVARTDAMVTVSADELPGATSSAEIVYFPADADPGTAGHQVAVASVGVTTAWVTAVGPSGLKPKSYRLRFFGAAPPGTPLTASFTDLPDQPRKARIFSFVVSFSEPIRTFNWFGQHFDVDGGNVRAVKRLSNDRWQVTISPDYSYTATVTISLPATTTGCADTTAICTFYAKPLSNASEATVQLVNWS